MEGAGEVKEAILARHRVLRGSNHISTVNLNHLR